ncbi:AAA family ATPase [Henriciella algicola]|uniref:Chromosome segregation protein SMC n=1 Tax=Henriciella algicola TaxID=1608422 RepID=A0A399RLG2_9PROT|nr:chromosome segregation protein SMC [Henriciella algicola]
MIVSSLKLRNWRNFRSSEISLSQRTFVLGANAAGKSNLLDVFRFLRDICSSQGGGLQSALQLRGGFSKVRCLSARQRPYIEIDITLKASSDSEDSWRYRLSITQEPRGFRRPIVEREEVYKNDERILKRPNADDDADPERLIQTHLEQVNDNVKFREISRFFGAITYLHLVPQLLRYADAISGRIIETDPFGQGFLERVAKTPERSQKSRLKRIEAALKIAVPNLRELKFERDEATGRPHLAALYEHWRPNAGWQQEDQFSDGTLRLIGLLWALLEDESLLLLEEPELSLNSGIVQQMAPLIYRMQRQRRRQVILSTHSVDLLSDKGIAPEEVVLLDTSGESTQAVNLSDLDEPYSLVKAGFSVGEAVLPKTIPRQIELFSTVSD